METEESTCSTSSEGVLQCWKYSGLKWLLPCLVAVVLVGALRCLVVGPQMLPGLQLIAAPLVIFLFSRLRIANERLPRWVIALSCIGVLSGAVLTYSHIDLGKGAFLVARLEDDEFEKSTKIFRDRVRRTVGWKGLTLIGTHSGIVGSEAAAIKILESNKKLGGIIWGTPRWLNVTLQRQKQSFLLEGEGKRYADDHAIVERMRKLQLITSIPSTGLSSSGEYPTVEFLGELAVAWSKYGTALEYPSSEDGFEEITRSLAGVKGPWTAFSHRAVPMWMTGTYHLRKYVSSVGSEDGELMCALRAFSAAYAQLREDDNPALKVAILNNQALAYMLRAREQKDRTRLTIQARRILKQALVLARTIHFVGGVGKVDITGRSIVEGNLNLISGGRERKSARRSKQQGRAGKTPHGSVRKRARAPHSVKK